MRTTTCSCTWLIHEDYYVSVSMTHSWGLLRERVSVILIVLMNESFVSQLYMTHSWALHAHVACLGHTWIIYEGSYTKWVHFYTCTRDMNCVCVWHVTHTSHDSFVCATWLIDIYRRCPTLHAPMRCRHSSWRRHTLQHTAPHCNTLQHTIPYCNERRHSWRWKLERLQRGGRVGQCRKESRRWGRRWCTSWGCGWRLCRWGGSGRGRCRGGRSGGWWCGWGGSGRR